MTIAGSEGGWKSGEQQLREREIHLREREVEFRDRELKGQRRARFWQAVGVILTTFAVGLAAVASFSAVRAVKVAQEGIQQQSDEGRLSSAIAAIGGQYPAQRVAGFTLLRRQIEKILERAVRGGVDAVAGNDAYNLYKMSLDVLENYLKNPAASAQAGDPADGSMKSGLGYGSPHRLSDSVYAADQLKGLLDLKDEVRQVAEEQSMPAVDLSRAELYGQYWPNIDFSWLAGHNFVKTDFRGATLTKSEWGRSSLREAYLQCANLAGANFNGTNLTDADLRGADMAGAHFNGAILTGAKLDGAFGLDKAYGLKKAVGMRLPEPQPSDATYDAQECLANDSYWTLPAPTPSLVAHLVGLDTEARLAHKLPRVRVASTMVTVEPQGLDGIVFSFRETAPPIEEMVHALAIGILNHESDLREAGVSYVGFKPNPFNRLTFVAPIESWRLARTHRRVRSWLRVGAADDHFFSK
jgi:Pentapeptide repeats (8 copies)